jgi:nucleoid-associated protein YgaU
MGFLDNVRGAIRDAVSMQTSKKDAVAVDQPESTPTTAPATAPATAPTEEPREAKFENYTVRTGDTLAEIGARFGVSPLEIATLNSIENPDLIFPGQVFRIPKN